MSDSIICTGNDLDQVCTDIEARGGRVESLDSGIGGNAGYRVNYFSPHQAEIPVKRAALAAVKSGVASRDPLNGPKIPCHGPACNPEHRKVNQSGSAETVGCGESFERGNAIGRSGVIVSKQTCCETARAETSPPEIAALTKFDGKLGATPSRRNDSRKAAVHEQPKNVTAPVVAGEHAVNPGCHAPVVGESSEVPGCETSGMTIAATITNEKHGAISIEDLLQRLHATLKENGKLGRGKPSTPSHHARTPYKD